MSSSADEEYELLGLEDCSEATSETEASTHAVIFAPPPHERVARQSGEAEPLNTATSEAERSRPTVGPDGNDGPQDSCAVPTERAGFMSPSMSSVTSGRSSLSMSRDVSGRLAGLAPTTPVLQPAAASASATDSPTSAPPPPPTNDSAGAGQCVKPTRHPCAAAGTHRGVRRQRDALPQTPPVLALALLATCAALILALPLLDSVYFGPAQLVQHNQQVLRKLAAADPAAAAAATSQSATWSDFAYADVWRHRLRRDPSRLFLRRTIQTARSSGPVTAVQDLRHWVLQQFTQQQAANEHMQPQLAKALSGLETTQQQVMALSHEVAVLRKEVSDTQAHLYRLVAELAAHKRAEQQATHTQLPTPFVTHQPAAAPPAINTYTTTPHASASASIQAVPSDTQCDKDAGGLQEAQRAVESFFDLAVQAARVGAAAALQHTQVALSAAVDQAQATAKVVREQVQPLTELAGDQVHSTAATLRSAVLQAHKQLAPARAATCEALLPLKRWLKHTLPAAVGRAREAAAAVQSAMATQQ